VSVDEVAGLLKRADSPRPLPPTLRARLGRVPQELRERLRARVDSDVPLDAENLPEIRELGPQPDPLAAEND